MHARAHSAQCLARDACVCTHSSSAMRFACSRVCFDVATPFVPKYMCNCVCNRRGTVCVRAACDLHRKPRTNKTNKHLCTHAHTHTALNYPKEIKISREHFRELCELVFAKCVTPCQHKKQCDCHRNYTQAPSNRRPSPERRSTNSGGCVFE